MTRRTRTLGMSMLGLCAAALLNALTASVAQVAEPSVDAVATTYADIAEAAYSDSVTEAEKLKVAVDALVATPTAETLAQAREAWVASRVPYMQTEVFRFGNKIVDDWEGKVNAWPLDEGLIDYVANAADGEGSENPLYAANVIANRSLKISGKKVDAGKIDAKLLIRSLHEAGGIEANVAIGYHAVEFLLWGQDLNGTAPGAGNRPHTDFDTKACTGGNCDRRAEYLRVVTNLLVEHLKWMRGQWGKDGPARRAVIKASGDKKLVPIFTGLGSLTYGELAGERMKLGLMIHDPEEEHDCFSDMTHYSHFYDLVGIENVYLGTYKRLDGSVLSGPSVSDLVAAKSETTDKAVRAALATAKDKMGALFERAKSVEAYDQMIGEDNAAGNSVVQAAINTLVALAKSFENSVDALGLSRIEFEGSDSLDDPAKVLDESGD